MGHTYLVLKDRIEKYFIKFVMCWDRATHSSADGLRALQYAANNFFLSNDNKPVNLNNLAGIPLGNRIKYNYRKLPVQ